MAGEYERGVQKLKNRYNEDTPSYHEYMQQKESLDITDAVPRRQSGGTPEQAVNTTHIPHYSTNIEDRRNESPPDQFDSLGLDKKFLDAEKYKK